MPLDKNLKQVNETSRCPIYVSEQAAGSFNIITSSTDEGKRIIDDSRQRSANYDILKSCTKFFSQKDLESILRQNERLINTAIPLIEQGAADFADKRLSWTLTNGSGVSLLTVADSQTHEKYKTLGVDRVATQLNETTVGTCAHGLVIQWKRPALIKGNESFLEALQHCTCFAVPILMNGRIIGILSVSSPDEEQVNSMCPAVLLIARCIAAEYKQSCCLSEREEIMCRILTQKNAAIFICDTDGQIICKNEGGNQLFNGLASKFDDYNLRCLINSRPELVESFCEGLAVTKKLVHLPGAPGDYYYSCEFFEAVGQCLVIFERITLSNKRPEITKRNLNEKHINFSSIVGDSPCMREAVDQAARFAEYDYTVLLTGESGVGKEMLAQAIHAASRPEGPFIAVNCASMPRTLIESELFGYVGGAFTGASPNGKAGKIEQANHGTLYLDEIGDMPMEMQPALLRVLQDKKVSRIGSDKTVPIDFRVISSTNKNLTHAIDAKTFREDLFYRLAVFTIPIPALRDRKEDIPILIDYFCKKHKERFKRSAVTLAEDAWQVVMDYGWPGNVRELENVIIYALGNCQDESIRANHLPPRLLYSNPLAEGARLSLGSSPNLSESLMEAEKLIVRRVLLSCGNNKKETAKALGISRTALYTKLKEYNLAGDIPLETDN